MHRTLTLQLSGAKAFLKSLHLIFKESDMPHHVLRRVYLHGYVSWGGRSWYRLVQLLLEDSSLKTNHTVGWSALQKCQASDNLFDQGRNETTHLFNVCKLSRRMLPNWYQGSLINMEPAVEIASEQIVLRFPNTYFCFFWFSTKDKSKKALLQPIVS